MGVLVIIAIVIIVLAAFDAAADAWGVGLARPAAR